MWAMLVDWHNAKLVLLHPLILVLAGMVLQFVPVFFLELLAVLCCGFGTMYFVGAAFGLLVLWLVRRLHRDEEPAEEDRKA